MTLNLAILIGRYRCNARRVMGIASFHPSYKPVLPRQHLLQRLLKGRYGAVDIAQFIQPE